jgi:lambda family phage tail tape measure protein
MSFIARLGVVLGLNNSEFLSGMDAAQKKSADFAYNTEKNLKKAEKDTANMMRSLGAASVALTGFALSATAVFRKAGDMEDMARSFDLSMESLISIQGALQDAGGEAENVTTMFIALAAAQQDAISGSTLARENFEKLGISGKDVESLNLEELFKRVAVGLSEISDKGKQAAYAQDLLKKAAKGVEWKTFAQEYKSFADPMLAQSILDNAAAWGHIEKAIKNLGLALQVILTPLAHVINYVASLFDTWKEMSRGGNTEIDFGAALGGMPSEEGSSARVGSNYAPERNRRGTIETKKAQTGTYSKLDKTVAKESENLLEKQRVAVIKQNDEYAKRLNLLKDTLEFQKEELDLAARKTKFNADDFVIAQRSIQLSNEITRMERERIREIQDAESAFAQTKSGERDKKLLDQKIQQINEYYADAINGQMYLNKITINNLVDEMNLKKTFEQQDLSEQTNLKLSALQRQYTAQSDLLNLEARAYELSTNDFNLMKLRIEAKQRIAELDSKYAEELTILNREYERTAKSARDRELYEAKVNNLNQLKDLEMNNMDTLDQKREQNFQKEVERQQSWTAGWNRSMKEYQETALKASERGAAAFNTVMSNMDRALRNFVDSGKFNFKDLVGSIVKDLLYMEMKAQAMMIFRMLLSSFGKVSSPSFGGSAGSIRGDLFGSPRAAGGDIDRPTLVGENGPEIFVPSRRGTVIPNTAASSWGSGQPSVTYNGPYIENMQAMDTQSASQFLAKNKMAVWSANMSAGRSVPTSR